MNNRLLSLEENTNLYGKCNKLHGHNYSLIVTVKGEIDPNGMVVNMEVVKQSMDGILKVMDHCHMDDLPYFSDKPRYESVTQHCRKHYSVYLE
jgi:6-pyruvoyltetrahydropterin/6-carboxytetrahydropterin synthase